MSYDPNKKFEDYVSDGTNNTLEALQCLIDGNPKFKGINILEDSKAGIKEALEKLNSEHPGISTNYITRLRKAVNNLNRNGGKLDVEITIDNEESLSAEQKANLEKVRAQRLNPPKQDGIVPKPIFASATEYKGKQIRMELEVKRR
jgi:hypothetical protein